MQGDTVAAADQEFTGTGNAEDLDAIRKFTVAYLRHEQDLDLKAFDVNFDVYFLESSLYTDGKVEAAVQTLIENGFTYEDGGALWLRTEERRSEERRVGKEGRSRWSS